MPGRPPAFVASRLGRVTPRNADDHLAVALARGRGLIWVVRAARKVTRLCLVGSVGKPHNSI